MKIDRKRFFDGIRHGPFPGRLKTGQVEGIDRKLDEFERRGMTDLRQLAYILATSFHETGQRMLPIREMGGAAYLTSMYDILGKRPGLARKNGNVNPGDGVRYSGKGDVQLTWRNNYRRMGRKLGIPLEDNPDLALDPRYSTMILFEGMIDGDFTGKSLSDYFPPDGPADWYNARRIINGVDRAAMIAGIAKEFYADLLEATRPDTPVA